MPCVVRGASGLEGRRGTSQSLENAVKGCGSRFSAHVAERPGATIRPREVADLQEGLPKQLKETDFQRAILRTPKLDCLRVRGPNPPSGAKGPGDQSQGDQSQGGPKAQEDQGPRRPRAQEDQGPRRPRPQETKVQGDQGQGDQGPRRPRPRRHRLNPHRRVASVHRLSRQ